jgi:hypothetical protein
MSAAASDGPAGGPRVLRAYRINAATVIEAASAAELVEKLRRWHWAAPATAGALMVLMAHEARTRYRVRIRATSAADFVEDMLQHRVFQVAPPAG